MPSLDYKTEVQVLGLRDGALGRRFYDGSPGRTLVRCPRCRRMVDELFPHDETLPECARLEHETAAVIARLNKTSVPKGRGGMEVTNG